MQRDYDNEGEPMDDQFEDSGDIYPLALIATTKPALEMAAYKGRNYGVAAWTIGVVAFWIAVAMGLRWWLT